jgi:hypothetical protein
VDDNRWHPHCSNLTYQQSILNDLAQFIPLSDALVVGPAGMITVETGWPNCTIAALNETIDKFAVAMRDLTSVNSKHEFLIGVDGSASCQATPLQTVVYLNGRPTLSLANTTVKLYPTQEEQESLIGWRICQDLGTVPSEFEQARRVQTKVGPILVLVCNDAIVFSSRSRANVRDEIRVAIGEHLSQQALTGPRVRYVVLATHWLGTTNTGGLSGATFDNAASNLADETGATVIISMHTGRSQLMQTANRFGIRGPFADRVATVLVEDTLE